MRVVVVKFPDRSLSYGGWLTDPDYAECEKWVVPIPNGYSSEYALKVFRKLTQKQKDLLQDFVKEECFAGVMECPKSELRTAKSLAEKGLIEIEEDASNKPYFDIALAQ